MKRFMYYAKLFYKYSVMSIKTGMEYKMGRFLAGVAIFFREMISVTVMYLLLIRFISIKGWKMNELFFLYSFLFISYALFIFLFTGIRDFDDIIHNGDFDRYLTRPNGLLFQIISSRVDYIAISGHSAVGILLFIMTARSVGINWNWINITYYISAIIGGAIIQASIFMVSSSFSFWAIRTINLRNLLFFSSRRFAGYPISFYPQAIQKLLIFIIPFAFVSYFPAQFFLRKPDLQTFWNGYLFLTPVIGIVMFILAYFFWSFSLKHYKSTGTAM